MKKLKVPKQIKNAQMLVSKHCPEILISIGIGGMFATAILSATATPKAVKLLEEAKDEKGSELTVPEAVKACWKCYIPAATTGIFSAACLIGANSVNAKRNAALLTAYKISETALTEYRDKVVETIGEKKEKLVRENLDKEHIEKNPVSRNNVIVTEKGNTLCFDTMSGRYFKSDIEKIKRAVNEINRRMLSEMYLSLNEFYDEIGLDHIDIGYDLGWRVDVGFVEIDFSSQIADDGTPCIVVSHLVPPKYGYSSFT